jgi:hypothetical protein
MFKTLFFITETILLNLSENCNTEVLILVYYTMSKTQGKLQRIMFYGDGLQEQMFMESRDGVSIPMMWNNLTKENFTGKEYDQYIEMMKRTAGLPDGNIVYYPDYSNKEKYKEFVISSSRNIELHKIELENRGIKLLFPEATKFSDLFTETKYGIEYVKGFRLKDHMTEACKKAVASWHCTQWGHSSFFEFFKRENGITDVYIKADQIIASSRFAVIYTNTIPTPAPEEEKEEKETVAISTLKKTVTAKMTAMDVFKKCTIDGNVIRLPKQDLGKDLYSDVKTILEKNGGAWKGGKIAGFVFKFNPASIFEKLQSGEKVNNKKKFQFFGTSPLLAEDLVTMAGLDKTCKKILEPSAGQAAIVNAIVDVLPHLWIDVCENMPENLEILNEHPNIHLICEDFLSIPKQYHNYYDRIIANPPFTNNQDIDHVMKMYECLKPGGRMVSVMSITWQIGKQKKQEAFKVWLKKVKADVKDVPAGAFKQSGTTVATCIVTINK